MDGAWIQRSVVRALRVLFSLCNGGSLYAPYSLLSISNMFCDGGGDRVLKLAVLYDLLFRVIKYGPWINLVVSVT